MSGVWVTPGSFSAIAHNNGYDSADHLHGLATLWTEHVRPLLPSFADNAGESAECGAALYTLIDLAEAWLRLGSRLVLDAERVNDDQVLAATEGRRRMINDLRSLIQVVPGLALRTQRLLRWCGAEDMATFEIDVQLNVVVGPEHLERVGDDCETLYTRRRSELEDVATQLADLGPQAGAARAIELIQQAELARPGADTALLIQLLASRASPVAAWFTEAVRQRWPLLIQAILVRSLGEDPDILDPAAVGSILDDAELHTSVITAVLTVTKRSPSVDLILDAMTAADAWHLRKSLIFRDTMDPVLERLLSHPVPVIAAATALALLFFEHWFEVQLGKRPYFRGQIRIRQDEEDPLAILPRVHRERLARRCVDLRYAGANPLTALIGTDAELAATLLQEGVVSTDMLLGAILGQRGAMLEALGPLLIRGGVTPEQVTATGNCDTAYGGPESSVHQKRLDYFTELSKGDDSDLRAISRAGIQQQQELVDQTLASERRQRVRGNL